MTPFLIMVALASGLLAAQGRPKAELAQFADADAAHAGSTIRIALQVSLPDGLHVQSNRPRDPLLIPTALTFQPPAGVTIAEIVYPEPTDFTQAGQKEALSVFEQRFVIGAKLALDRTLPPGELVIPAGLRYQACDASTCFAPTREESRWTLKVVAAGAPVTPRLAEVFDRIPFRR